MLQLHPELLANIDGIVCPADKHEPVAKSVIALMFTSVVSGWVHKVHAQSLKTVQCMVTCWQALLIIREEELPTLLTCSQALQMTPRLLLTMLHSSQLS